ncbi:MAG: PQQ-dependent catabolism-associated CXXCW motif protein [Candidatus Thiodiazotropha sp.]|nr:PQQ-dependent catabolism-associated CXXCW motif protein [Candidatus Thiodiazotropha taylori]MBT3058424.1 PQQ-dependent catabolism-associated CXXCW motif protein [Candidatus Thiodiazotropha sp. (ex Lucina pensylvanica)]MBV2094361.1 PQQ-dependent catabolism-associated CXXCW motif protein [Candidatus Thiodiazotropha sp. (ex Codakia orbicularis)]PUB74750.1 MAG: rhodanese [gamma proteobacterium symbiont of Ctena orbiculata]PUB76966.1 MAG: rhodanese [gamma proteobacterium symbiont of Ctena orbicul
MKPASKPRSAVKLRYGFASLLLSFLFASASSASTAAESSLFSSDGYRIDQFRAPVPDSVPSGTTITTEQLQTLHRERDLLLIDVMPAPVKPKDRPDTLLWLPPARDNIPGSHWLPNVGYGALSDQLERYFKDNLERLSSGDKSREIVLYCLADCWMSWNAARRAATEYGYTNIYWYPDGTTGWEAAGLPVEQSAPIPMD